jgi:hypothetical protein
MKQFVAVIRRVPYTQEGAAETRVTFLDLFYSNGRACGVPQYVGGYEEAAQRLRLAGVSTREIGEKRRNFARGQQVRFAVSANDETVKAMGFEPLWWVPARFPATR